MTETFKDILPPELVKHISAICGHRGEAWFGELPRIIHELERQWSLKVLKPFPGIEFNFVAPAVLEDGIDAVVKISPPFERIEIHSEAKYLRVRGGQGAVELLAEDRDRRAILIEYAMPGEALFKCFSENPFRCVDPAIEVLRSILRPPPPDMSDVDTLDNWFYNFRRYRETDFPKRYAEKAFEIYERLSNQPDRTFYLHGDFHPGNVVTATRERFLAIDPKGIVGHIGYEISVFLNNLHWWQKKDPDIKAYLKNAIRQFAAAFDLNERELREWAYAGMVIGAWWNFDDMPEHYDGEVALADIWDV
jgi:streptomycin 6-kinase